MPETAERYGQLDGKHCKLTLSSERLEVEILDYNADTGSDLFNATPDDRLVVDLTNGKTATLLGNALSFRHSNGDDFILTRLKPARVLVGPREFLASDTVASISFRPTNEHLAIFHRAHRGFRRVDPDEVLAGGELTKTNYGLKPIIVQSVDERQLTAARVELPDLTMELAVQITHSSGIQGSEITERRLAHLTYSAPTSVNDALADVIALCNFFTLIVGEVVSPLDMKLLPPEEVSQSEALEIEPTDENVLVLLADDRFEFHVVARKPGAEIAANQAHRCLVSPAFDTVDYQTMLAGWMARRTEWREAYRGLAETCALQRQISTERLLSAVRWFEATPTFYLPQSPKIPSALIDRAARLGERFFSRAGQTVSAARIKSLLAPLNATSLNVRLQAAVKHIEERFGADVLPKDACDRVKHITALRGRAAHGDRVLSAATPEDFYESLWLVEGICWLLMLSQLPWSYARLEKSPWHPFRETLTRLKRIAARRASKKQGP